MERERAKYGRAAEPKSGESVDVTSRIWHTVFGAPYPEGTTYAVTNRIMAETLYAIGFVTIDGWTPPPEPPTLDELEDLRTRDARR